MGKFDFSKLEDRTNTMAAKWDKRKEIFGSDDILPMWVADSDWQTAPAVKKRLQQRTEHGIFGYSFADQSIYQAVQNWQQQRFNLDIKKDKVNKKFKNVWETINNNFIKSCDHFLNFTITGTQNYAQSFAEHLNCN